MGSANFDLVIERHWNHDGIEQMITVGSLADDTQI
jgi:hypothetical protein